MIFAATFPLTSQPYISARDAVLNMIKEYHQAFMWIVAVGFLLHLVIMIWNIFLKSEVGFVHIIYVFVILVVLRNYTTIMQDFDSGVTGLVYSTMYLDKGVSYKEHNSKTATQKIFGQIKKNKESGGKELTVLNVFSNIDSLFLIVGSFLTQIFAELARLIVSIFSMFISVFLLAVGPLVISFGFIPGFNQVVRGWLAMILTVKFYFVTITVVDQVLVHINTSIFEALDKNVNDDMGMLMIVLQVVGGCLYVMVPFLTAIYVPSAGSQFMSMAVGAATMVSKAAIAVGTKGASLIK